MDLESELDLVEVLFEDGALESARKKLVELSERIGCIQKKREKLLKKSGGLE
ncbi:MAG: hypothetical protein ACOC2U_01745 [bacterium]